MKLNEIYVGANGAKLQLTSGYGVAVYPAKKGMDRSFVLMEDGRMVTLKGSRIDGVGVPRFLAGQGFALAEPGNEHAATLADLLDIQDGIKLVEEASTARAAELHAAFDGQACTFVPFDPERPHVPVTIEAPKGYITHIFDLSTGFDSGGVAIKFDVGNGWGSTLKLSDGWIVGPNEDPAAVPRNTEYGGLVERSVYVICNCGLGSLVGAQHLEMDENAAEDAPYPRGKLEVKLANGDHVIVGIDGGDELVVSYLRQGEILYSRTGMPKPRLGEVIGAIAAVLVRVRDLDATPAKKSRVKKAA